LPLAVGHRKAAPRQYGRARGDRIKGALQGWIPPTPTNFAAWFQDFAGSHDDPRIAIDLLIDHNCPIDARVRTGEAIGDLIARCAPLYLAKGGGRNRVVTEIALDRAGAAG
jgi:hypothetical protein